MATEELYPTVGSLDPIFGSLDPILIGYTHGWTVEIGAGRTLWSSNIAFLSDGTGSIASTIHWIPITHGIVYRAYLTRFT